MDAKRKKQLSIGGLIVIVITGIAYGFWPKPVLVDTGKVTRGPMQLTIEEEGKTRVKDRYILAAPVSGMLDRIHLKAGDQIKAGMTVAELQPVAPELLNERQYAVTSAQLKANRAALDQARENLRMATEEASFAQKELARVENLHKAGVGSDQELDNAVIANRRTQTNKTSAEFAVKIAQHEVESTLATLQWSKQKKGNDDLRVIRSPIDGLVLNVPNQSERPVMAGEPLLEIGDPQSLEIRVDLLSTDAVQVHPATEVLIKRWGGNTILEGSVRVVEPAGYTKISTLGVEEQRVPVIVDITSDRKLWSRLGDGYRVIADFILWEEDNVLQVPTSALFRSGKEWALFVLQNSHAIRKTVTIGHQTGLNTEIISGLKEGEVVLTHPDERIKDGVSVEPRK